MKNTGYAHTPVLVNEVIQNLNIRPDGIYIDCTFGRGGHSKAILQCLGENGRLFAFDKDPDAISSADKEISTDKRFCLYRGSYTRLKEVAKNNNMMQQVDGILFDLGVSSPQLETAARGFSFLKAGPLDMRMDNSGGITAQEWLESASADEIAEILRKYGEERFARRIARAIVNFREENKIETTQQLAEIAARAIPVHEKDKHPATRTFQALRIFINSELDELENALAQTIEVLKVGGRLVVISFHSLEDRIVKRFMRDKSRGDDYPVDLPVPHSFMKPELKIIGKSIRPGMEEITLNPRARSAVLRTAEKIAA